MIIPIIGTTFKFQTGKCQHQRLSKFKHLKYTQTTASTTISVCKKDSGTSQLKEEKFKFTFQTLTEKNQHTDTFLATSCSFAAIAQTNNVDVLCMCSTQDAPLANIQKPV